MSLETATRVAWKAWGGYAMFTFCSNCRLHVYCRRSGRSDWLCLDCFDQSHHAVKHSPRRS